MKPRYKNLLRLPLVMCLTSSPGAGHNATAGPQLTIVATTSMLGDAVRQIVQERAQVITLMGPGVDPHAYQPTQQDLRHLCSADVVCYNGLHLEGKMAAMLHKLGRRQRVYAAAEALEPAQLRRAADLPTGADPHIWFDVQLWRQVVQYISQQLQAAAPKEAGYYKENTARYLQQLAVLHEETQKAIQQIPPQQRVLITAHDAFGYFGRAYGLEVRALQGISTMAECGLRDVTDLVELILAKKIKAIFLETSVPARAIQAVLASCAQQAHQVSLGGTLYSDALGPAGTPAATYHGAVQANVRTIVNALK